MATASTKKGKKSVNFSAVDMMENEGTVKEVGFDGKKSVGLTAWTGTMQNAMNTL